MAAGAAMLWGAVDGSPSFAQDLPAWRTTKGSDPSGIVAEDRAKYFVLERERIEGLVTREFAAGLTELSDAELADLLEDIIRNRGVMSAPELWSRARRAAPQPLRPPAALQPPTALGSTKTPAADTPSPSLPATAAAQRAPSDTQPESASAVETPPSPSISLTADAERAGRAAAATRRPQSASSPLPLSSTPSSSVPTSELTTSSLAHIQKETPPSSSASGRVGEAAPDLPSSAPRGASPSSVGPSVLVAPPASAPAIDLPGPDADAQEEPDFTRQLLSSLSPFLPGNATSSDSALQTSVVGQGDGLSLAGPLDAAGGRPDPGDQGGLLPDVLASLRANIPSLDDLPGLPGLPALPGLPELPALPSWVVPSLDAGPGVQGLALPDLSGVAGAAASASEAIVAITSGVVGFVEGAVDVISDEGDRLLVPVGLIMAGAVGLVLIGSPRRDDTPAADDSRAGASGAELPRQQPAVMQPPSGLGEGANVSQGTWGSSGAEGSPSAGSGPSAAVGSGEPAAASTQAWPWTSPDRLRAALAWLPALLRRKAPADGDLSDDGFAGRPPVANGYAATPGAPQAAATASGPAPVATNSTAATQPADAVAAAAAVQAGASKPSDPRLQRLMDNGPALGFPNGVLREAAAAAAAAAASGVGVTKEAEAGASVVGEGPSVLWRRSEPAGGREAPAAGAGSAGGSGTILWQRADNASRPAPGRPARQPPRGPPTPPPITRRTSVSSPDVQPTGSANANAGVGPGAGVAAASAPAGVNPGAAILPGQVPYISPPDPWQSPLQPGVNADADAASRGGPGSGSVAAKLGDSQASNGGLGGGGVAEVHGDSPWDLPRKVPGRV